VTNPFDGAEVGSVVDMPAQSAAAIIAVARDAARVSRGLSRADRARILEACA
jgi:acyl-CoA reductase-like NAD-dependent aldehyde dehydrogenase